jgi:dihydrofolate synthase / folylpolyglutamate synthase
VNYSRVEAFLDSFVNYELLPGFGFAESGYDLSHVRELLRRLGDPHLGPRTVHIAGSKGKGSVSAMAASALSACGLTTGLYTSPHLVHLGERIRVNGAYATAGDLEAAIKTAQPHMEAMVADGRWRRFTYFEVLTVLAFLHFHSRGVDAQVVEVGLGGRLDATNVVAPDVCVITPISLEHTAVLGDTAAKIAVEKSGIIKPGAAVVCAPQPVEALRVIESVCASHRVSLVNVGTDITWEVCDHSLEGQVIRSAGVYAERVFRIPLVGLFQAENAVTAMGALEALRARGLRLDEQCVESGLAHTHWPGRFQVLARHPLLVLDGAHNPASMHRLAESLALFVRGGDLVFVLGFSSDKDVAGSVTALSHLGGRVILTRSAQSRALALNEMALRIADLGVEVQCVQDPMDALRRARTIVCDDGTVCVAGSLYLVGEVWRRWRADMESGMRWVLSPCAMTRVTGR